MEQTYGARLAAALKLKNFRQSDLAKKLKIPPTAISKIINGIQYLDFDLAVKACEILEISLNWLAGQPHYKLHKMLSKKSGL